MRRALVLAVPLILAACLRGPSVSAKAGGLYDSWPNGPPKDPAFFPIAVWYQSPTETGHSANYANLAAAAAGAHINIFLGLNGKVGKPNSWPERFGADLGELEAIRDNKLYVIGGIHTPHDQNTSANSVASMLALARSIHALPNLIGYNMGDEPDCAAMATGPADVARLASYDPTRIVTLNQTAWGLSPHWTRCLPAAIATMRAASVASADFYPLTRPWVGAAGSSFARSDFRSTPNDTLFRQGLMTRALAHFAQPGQPIWAFVESGGDNFGYAEQGNKLKVGLVAGSAIVTNQSGVSRFTDSWLGLKLTGAGLAPNTSIVAIRDPSHAEVSAPALTTDAAAKVSVTGGEFNSDCVARVNLCVVNGNEFRATPAQVNAEVWMSLINGANGVEYFCHDTSSYSFCLGDPKGGAAAAAAQANLTYINASILRFARVLNAETLGLCSQEQENFETGATSTTERCVDGLLTLRASTLSTPGAALLKRLDGVTYLFAQPTRRSDGPAEFAFTIAGSPHRIAKIIYDSNARYDPTHADLGRTIPIDAKGTFTDLFGDHRNDYQVKIYEIR